MKRTALKRLAETIEKTMDYEGISAKELAKKSGISYSSLTPIINGSRDFGVSKLIALAEALEATPNALLDGLYEEPKNNLKSTTTHTPEYIAIFISVISVTYCMIYEVESKNKVTSVLQFPLRCSQPPEEFLEYVITSIQRLSKSFTKNISNHEIAVFVSVQQFGRAASKKKIQKIGEHAFANFIMEPDATTNHRALLNNKNGICISINDGDAITYSTDHGKTITKLQGYGFPISDIAGNYWIGCEAIKHAINVKEKIESDSLLSDKILALFNDDIDFLSESTMMNPAISYIKASSIVKELLHKKQQSYNIVKRSADVLMARISLIDKDIKNKLPIIITGDLAYIYEEFIPEQRIIKTKERHNDILLNYGLTVAKQAIA